MKTEPKHRTRLTVAALGLIVLAPACGPDPAPPAAGFQPVKLEGGIRENEDLSAVAFLDPGLALASDEGDLVQFLAPGSDPGSFVKGPDPVALTEFDREVDIEGLERSGDWLYVLGSHSIKRPRLDADDSPRENRRRIAGVDPEPFRQRVFRIPLHANRKGRAAEIGLRPILERDPLLAPFTRIPAGENGLNLEGLGADGTTVYCGLRSPVLRGGYVPVVVFPFDRPADYTLRFVELGGRGIRGMARVDEGWLLLAAFERGPSEEVEIFFWNGADQLPGPDGRRPRAERLVVWPGEPDGVAEAITVLAEEEDGYEVLVLFDGIPDGAARRGRVPRPEDGS